MCDTIISLAGSNFIMALCAGLLSVMCYRIYFIYIVLINVYHCLIPTVASLLQFILLALGIYSHLLVVFDL